MAVAADPTESSPIFPGHANDRWAERSNHPEIGLAQAWSESIPVGLPDGCPWGPNATLHDPGNVVLIYDEAREKNYEFVIKTVLHGELLGTRHSILDGHLETCECCEYRYDPHTTDGECQWCDLGYGPELDELVEKLNSRL